MNSGIETGEPSLVRETLQGPTLEGQLAALKVLNLLRSIVLGVGARDPSNPSSD
jgi:hypothetical protein